MPCWEPPYGLSSYDMNTGKLNWGKPFGQVQKWGFYMPESWGSVTIGAPVITKSGLVFIGASMDSRVRAIDLKTGNVLWKALVDAPAVAQPGPIPTRASICGVRRRRQRHPDAEGQRPGHRIRLAAVSGSARQPRPAAITHKE